MRITGLLGLLVVAVLLAGCGAPTPTPPSPSSTTPAATELVAPQPGLQLACDSAASPGLVADFLGEQSVETFDNGVDPVRGFYDLEELQSGVLQCTWTVIDIAAAGFAVMPAAASEYAGATGWYDVDQQYVRHDEFGDDSRHYCGYGYCAADILVGDLWVFVHGYRPDLMDELDAEPLFVPFAREVVESVREAAANGLRDAWSIPDGAYRPVPGFCDDAIVEGMAEILGVPSLFETGSDGYGAFTVETWKRSGRSDCTLAADDGTAAYGHARVTPGSLWSFPQHEGNAHPRFGDYATTSADVDGGEALVAESDLGAAAIFPVRGSLVSVGYDGLTGSQLLELLPAVAELYLANPQ